MKINNGNKQEKFLKRKQVQLIHINRNDLKNNMIHFSDSEISMYTNEYWECKLKQDWSRCDDIF